MPDISIELLRRLVSYDPSTGELTWNERTEQDQPNGPARMGFNRRFAGKPAMTCKLASGHMHGRAFGKFLLAHRVAWAVHNGEWPKHVIDHINGDPADNRISNLRDVRQSVNARNSRMSKRNKSGHVGVVWREHAQAWRAYITINGKQRHLGYFKSASRAASARRDFQSKHGFTDYHGTAPVERGEGLINA